MYTSLISLVVAIAVYNIFFFRMAWGISFFVLIAGLNALLFINHKPTSKLAFFFSGVSCVAGLLFSLTSNSFLQSLDVATTWSALLLAILFTFAHKPPVLSTITFILGPVLTAIQYIGCIFFKIIHLGGEASGTRIPKGMGAVVRGLLLGLPVFLVLYVLLSSADPIFSTYSVKILKQIGPRTIQSLVVAALLIPLVVGWVVRTVGSPTWIAKRLSASIFEAGVIVASISLLFLGFLIVQFQYLFHTVAETALVKFGITTYSAYVRKGFIELLLAATIAYGVIFVTVWLNQHRTLGRLRWIQWLNTVLIVEVGALIASNAKRVYIYQTLHGLTRIRVFGSLFLLWLTFMLASLFFKNWKQAKQRSLFTLVEVIATVGVLIFSHWVNVDGLIATRFPPTVNKEVDYVYISRLSADGVEGWLPAIVNARKVIVQTEEKGQTIDAEKNRNLFYVEMSLRNIHDRVDALKKIYGQPSWPWQRYNFREYSAWQYIQRHPEFMTIDDLLGRVGKLESTVSQAVRQNTQYDRSLDHPLIGD